MIIRLNGEPVRLDGPLTVRELLASGDRVGGRVGGRSGGRAVAVNGAVVPASAQATTVLGDGDVVEVVLAVAGG